MPKVAIIEDDKSILEMYRIKFAAEGFTVYSAVNGSEGLDLLSGIKPDIVLLDLMMPEMDGTTMLRKLRSTPWGKTIPVLILTNVSEDEAPDELKDLDISGYIVKASTTPHVVFERVRRILSA